MTPPPAAKLGELNAFVDSTRRPRRSSARVARVGGAVCLTLPVVPGSAMFNRASSSYRTILRAGFELDYVRANYLPTSGTA